MNNITTEIERLRELSTPELVDRYHELWGKSPRCRHREWLWKRCAWRLQERCYGGLSNAAKSRLEQLISEIDLPIAERSRTVSGTLRGRARGTEHKLGTVFTRTFKGREVRAVAVEGGYEHDGIIYTSLTAVAKAITGSHWNGRLFFGLTSRSGTK